MTKPTWTPIRLRLGQLKAWSENPRMSNKSQAQRIIASERKFGQPVPFLVAPETDGAFPLLDGHQRLAAWFTVYGADYEMDAMVCNRPLTVDEHKELVITLHTGATGSWNWDNLSSWSAGDLQAWGMSSDTLKEWNNDANNLKELLNAEQEEPVDAEPQIDRAAELAEKWQTATGQLWKLGDHRLLIGDCTEVINVSKLLGGNKVNLVHADPPYGMGKNEIENDNLYKEKLDLFQMQWFDQCRSFIADNSSVYIWGNAEDLWRLWFTKLSKSERMTFRNEIVWDKSDNSNPTLRVNGKTFEGMRSFYNSERVLFFMLGEQGFNNNSDNYWDGWENIRSSLFEDCEKMGWGAKDIERICGVGMYGHWFTKSQWTLIPEEHYKKLQAAAREHDAFKREHDELKREFYNTRSSFNVLPENMTDVWNFPTLQGNDRPDHPTPKPVEMMERIFKTSGTDDAVIYSPFLGSGTDIIAGQNCGRKVYGLEKDTAYAGVILERFYTATGITPELLL